jgi:hypothetical protein
MSCYIWPITIMIHNQYFVWNKKKKEERKKRKGETRNKAVLQRMQVS